MKNHTHTPGPWKVRLTHKELSGIDYLDITTLGETERICHVDSTVPKHETEANARLIAAAPSMLEALRSIKVALLNCPMPLWTQVPEGFDAALMEIDEAIQQAEGR